MINTLIISAMVSHGLFMALILLKNNVPDVTSNHEFGYL